MDAAVGHKSFHVAESPRGGASATSGNFNFTTANGGLYSGDSFL